MSRIANQPIELPQGTTVTITGQVVEVKGTKGSLSHNVHALVEVAQAENVVNIKPANDTNSADAQAGTARALINNMVKGVTQGFEKKLTLIGVGYRAKVEGRKVNLTLGFSHPVVHDIPEGITVDMPSATEMTIKGIDKQVVGQVAAEIRAYRPPEPYKGKGVRYSDERITLKETKKK
jgi:large subunit ribosomal protein L6